MIFHATPLAGLFEIDTEPHADSRGSFTRVHCEETLAEIVPGLRVVQVNHSVSRQRGTLRGLHFQHAPAADGKLVRCLRGQVFDVAVDLRRGSPTFARWHAVELAGGGTRGLWLPPGFAHGFQTLAEDTELLYLHTAAHAPAHEAGLRFDDARLAIPWPLAPVQLSQRDQALPFLTPQFQGVAL